MLNTQDPDDWKWDSGMMTPLQPNHSSSPNHNRSAETLTSNDTASAETSASTSSVDTTTSAVIQYKRGGFPQRAIHLVTWSQAIVDAEEADPRTAFALKVVGMFENLKGKMTKLPDGESLVDRWACSLEDHQNGGEHFHLLLRTRRRVRAYDIWRELFDMGIKVNFSDNTGTYWQAYGYITKSDKQAKVSEGHPSNGQLPTSAADSQAEDVQVEQQQTTNSKKRKSSADKNLEIRQIIIQNNLRDDDDLCAFASKMEKEGCCTITEWILQNRKKSQRLDMINTVWDLKEAPERVKSRTQLKVCKYSCTPLNRACTVMRIFKDLEVFKNVI